MRYMPRGLPHARGGVSTRDEIVAELDNTLRQEQYRQDAKEFGITEQEAQYQFEETEQRLGGREGYDKAKADGKSELNYRQWVQVRTPAFKSWFGDWELATATPQRKARNFAEAREQAKAFQSKPLTNAQSGIVATVSRNNLDKMLSNKTVGKSVSPAIHSLAVANLDSLFEKSVHGWSKPDAQGDPNIKAIHRFFTPMMVDGRAVMAKLTVKETIDPNHANGLYTVEAVEFEAGKSPAAQWVDAAANADGIDLTSIRSAGLLQSMAQSVQDFNPDDVSKVINPRTGEPLVVYHGTMGDFFEFSPELKGAATKAASARQGFFFADNRVVANFYTRGKPLPSAQEQADRATLAEPPDRGRSPRGTAIFSDEQKSRRRAAEKRLYDLAVEKLIAESKVRKARELWREYTDEMWSRYEMGTIRAVEWLENNPEGRKNDPEFAELVDRIGKASKLLLEAQMDAAGMHVGGNVLPVFLKVLDPLDHNFRGEDYRDETYNDLLKEAVLKGRDGAIFENTYDSGAQPPGQPRRDEMTTVFVVFNPNQIKSAIGNTGQFGVSDNILNQLPPETRRILAKNELLTGYTLLALDDTAFQLPVTTETTIPDILRAQMPGISRIQLDPDAAAQAKDASTAWTVTIPVVQSGKATTTEFKVYQNKDAVWIDVSRLSEGNDGKRVYNAVANYAYNTGKVFIGDPDGLSKPAQSRRLENMISSALKFGTTDHLWPHDEQLSARAGVPAIKWKDGDFAGNLESMIRASYEATLKQFPEIADLRYDGKSDNFVDVKTGKVWDEQRFNKLASKYDESGTAVSGQFPRRKDDIHRSPVTAGRRTLERAVFTHTLLRGTRQERSQLLAQIGEFGSQRLTGVLYQTGGKSAADIDKAYFDAIEAGDLAAAQKMVDEAAAAKGYASSSDFRMNHRAPSRADDGESPSLVELVDSNIVPDDYWTHPHYYTSDYLERRAFYKVKEVLDEIRESAEAADGGSIAAGLRIKMYRAVPKNTNCRANSAINAESLAG